MCDKERLTVSIIFVSLLLFVSMVLGLIRNFILTLPGYWNLVAGGGVTCFLVYLVYKFLEENF